MLYPILVAVVVSLLLLGVWIAAWPDDLPWPARRWWGVVLFVVAIVIARVLTGQFG